jgi:deaminated glutathione amidase
MAKIALLQMTSGVNPKVNSAVLVDAVHSAASQGAQMLFTPEMSGLLDRDRVRAAGSIVTEERDVALSAVKAAAREAGMSVSIGSLAVRTNRGDGLYANRAFVIDEIGEVLARYDKMHMFDVDLAHGETWRESAAYAPGDHAVVVGTPIGQLGLSICYDIRFPALYQALSGAGATLLSVPAAFTAATGRAHWHTLLKARAIENACWVIAAAQSGEHEDGRSTFGHSLVVNPWGEIVLDMENGCGLACVEIDLSEVVAARNRVPVLAHRRAIAKPDVPS